ncbi:DUF559 domain-containing protein [Agrococcus sp. HG114]|uniref:DUF559 domain-containing protein n=1 Tax=Agrococcus sp. HG114 TaxID=2969757 RepID=UPI00215B587F|nr:DUF559 domain-containing protein [Agrococcus sp. HG114]MCR8669922.1 DUF559 domain-containing protein [Agrococcus sp. HG114]
MSTLRSLGQGSVRIDEFQELLAAGSSRRAIEAALRSGRLERARRDVYVRHPAPAALVHALRIGGRLACASAAEFLGLWVPRDGRLHVHLWDGSTRLRDRDDRLKRLERREGLALHWSDLVVDDGTRCATSVGSAVRCIAGCFGIEAAIRVADSALQRRRADRAEIRRALDGFAWLEAPAIDAVDGLCGSGYETDAKLLLLAAGLAFEQQVALPRVGIVDFVVCGCVVVEVDGRETHEGAFEADRARDAEALLLGYVTVRVSARWLDANPGRFIELVRAALAVHPRG